ALFVAVTFTALLVFANSADNDEVSQVAPFLLATLALCVAPLFLAREQDIFAPAPFHGLQEASRLLPGLITLLAYGDSQLGLFQFLSSEARISLLRSVCVMLSLAQLGYLVGYFGTRGALVARWLPALSGRLWRPPRFLLVLLLLSLIFVVSYAQFQEQAGGSLLDVTMLAEGKRVWRDDTSLSWMLRGVWLGFLPVILLGTVAITSNSRAYVVATLVLYGIAALLITRLGQRGPAIQCLLILLMLFHYLRRRVPLALCAAVFLVVVAGTTLLGEYRSGVTPNQPLVERIASPTETMVSYEAERQHMTVYATIMHFFPDEKEYLMGESWAAVLVALVPRWLWADKPDFAPWRETRIVYNLIALPAPTPYPALLYANFSWPGVFLGMFLYGFVHRGLYEWRKRSASDANTNLIYVLVLTTFSPTAFGFSTMLQLAFPALVALYFMMLPRSGPANPATPSPGATPQHA
ncbi:MAG TPA: O-antigen polymerase, partial [Polyangiaceae bacterium]|nr:O-antigen polymerase [Polyangiaceae bacterium]